MAITFFIAVYVLSYPSSYARPPLKEIKISAQEAQPKYGLDIVKDDKKAEEKYFTPQQVPLTNDKEENLTLNPYTEIVDKKGSLEEARRKFHVKDPVISSGFKKILKSELKIPLGKLSWKTGTKG